MVWSNGGVDDIGCEAAEGEEEVLEDENPHQRLLRSLSEITSKFDNIKFDYQFPFK